jgi:hypothetical protein
VSHGADLFGLGERERASQEPQQTREQAALRSYYSRTGVQWLHGVGESQPPPAHWLQILKWLGGPLAVYKCEGEV